MIVLQLLLYCLLFTAMVKNRCDRRCCQWTILLSQGGAGSRHRTGTDRPQYDEPETKMLYDTVLYRDACCSCADYRFVERGFLLW